VAIAKHATRGKEYLVMIRPHEEGLLLEQLFYQEEIRSFAEVPLDEGEVNEAELKLALQLIDQAASDGFDASEYNDEVYERTMELIEKKVEGQEITAAPAEESRTQIIDLMAALKASLSEDDAESGTGEEKKGATGRSGGKKAASG
jgi:DNA end-binding protein Ku